MPEFKFITHNDTKILILDFSKAKPEESITLIQKVKGEIRKHPKNSLSIITDVSDMRVNKEITQAMKDFTAHNKPYVKKSCVVGITGIKKVLYSAVIKFSNRDIQLCTNKEEAKQYLAKKQ